LPSRNTAIGALNFVYALPFGLVRPSVMQTKILNEVFLPAFHSLCLFFPYDIRLHLGTVFEMIATFGFHQTLIFKGLERSSRMPKPDNFLTAQEFAQNAGVSAATVSKWLREGTILGKKISGKWSISSDELAKVGQSLKATKTPSKKPAADPKPQPPKPTAKSYSIREFSDMSYLTEYGVQKWLKEGRLKKAVGAEGQVRVDGSSLEAPHVKRLLR
jgi:hypothetical protein